MILFFKLPGLVYGVESLIPLPEEDITKLTWLFYGARPVAQTRIKGFFTGPRREMITPWSTNAVEITQNMGIRGIKRIEEFRPVPGADAHFDHMLQALYRDLDQELFHIGKLPDPVLNVDDIATYNFREGLALSEDEILYLEQLSRKLNRPLTDTEVFGFSQVNSEHCRHKIFNGTFILNGQSMPESLFQMIKKTSALNPNRLVSAYQDNCAFTAGPVVEQFAPLRQDTSASFSIRQIRTVLSLKAETHNFPTTVEPFNGAATGSGGEIRDRMAGGKGSIPMAGTAVYMTSYPRLESSRSWETTTAERKWLYQTPAEILIKASNGASDFGNKFGQPLICGSLLTFEHQTHGKLYGYDKVIMLAGGIGFGKKDDSHKDVPSPGDVIVVMGGDNYRIGMGGGAVSSVATGEYGNAIELNAVQRSNPEMQKRVANALRALTELTSNPVVAIHDHGAGGHLNSLSELVEKTGGKIYLGKLPVGDPTLSSKEIMGNESQERMGLILKPADLPLLQAIAERERAPLYVVGEVTGDMVFRVIDQEKNEMPLNLNLEDMFGKPPKTVLIDNTVPALAEYLNYDAASLHRYLEEVLQLEAVACKDWLTNKVDRSVTGKVALQQTAGTIQLPVNNLGAVALDYQGEKGIATAIGHAPVAGLISPELGSVLSIAESLTNIIWAPVDGGLKSVSLSANWMWPARNNGEDDRLYRAVKAASDFAIALGINIPTGKDSLSMTQKYPGGNTVYAPGTVIISSMGEITDIRKIVTPVIRQRQGTKLIYIDLSDGKYELGGSSFAQMMNKLGTATPNVCDPAYFAHVFEVIQALIQQETILAGHDISAGGMITTLLEMTFTSNTTGLDVNLSSIGESDIIQLLFSENPGLILQVEQNSPVPRELEKQGIIFHTIGTVTSDRNFSLVNQQEKYCFDIDSLRDLWFKTSYLLDRSQCGPEHAINRYRNFKNQPLAFRFTPAFAGQPVQYGIDPARRTTSGIKAAIIREKGVNGDREMAWSLYLAGFDVKDVHMTDLISGREILEELNLIVFVGGFSNSDVLGSGRGWAGAFLYNEKARETLDRFYARADTLSLGICNGCQVMMELGLVYPEFRGKARMLPNSSGKFESSFLNVDIMDNPSVMLGSMAGSRLGIWVAHGEGRFELPGKESDYIIPVKFSYPIYPGNPNGSDFQAAALVSRDGRHLVMMPHIERAIYPWQWANYPEERRKDIVSPWIEAFVNAREWIKANT